MASEQNAENIYTVVLIGAGAAGLEAANVLLASEAFRNGHLKVVLLEARDRVGGRILVDRRWGVPFDCGPNWIHGTMLNPLVPLAKITKTHLTLPNEASQTVFTSSGKPLSLETSQALYETVWNYADEAIEYSVGSADLIPPEWSMYDYCLSRIEKDNKMDPESKLIAMQMTEMLTTFTAVDIREQSLRHYQVEAELEGDCPFVASTYEPILEHLAGPSQTAGIIQLSTSVTRISVHSDHISVAASTTFAANAVIVTVPLGCLRKSAITFDPPLPQRVQSAISDLGFGNLEKVFLKFEEAWWKTESKLDPPEIFTFLPPITLPPSAPSQLLTMFSLADLPVNAQPVLVTYLAGAISNYLACQSPKEVAAFFQTHYLPLLPNYTSHCIVVDVFCTNWANDPFAHGSYAHVPVGSMNGVEDLRVLGEKIFDLEEGRGGLWFAGEHAGTGDLATVNGAMTSGRSAAIEVLRTFGEDVENIMFGTERLESDA